MKTFLILLFIIISCSEPPPDIPGCIDKTACNYNLEANVRDDSICIFPPTNLCSDNAAMIAWAGIERYKINLIDSLEFQSRARWPLDSSAPFLKGPGTKI